MRKYVFRVFNIMNNVLKYFDMKLVRYSGIFGSKIIDEYANLNPLEALFLARGSRVLVNVQMKHVRILHSNSFLPDDCNNNPWTITVNEFLSGEIRSYKGSAMQCFYKQWQPSCAAEYFGLKKNNNNAWYQSPPYAVPLPWIYADINLYEKNHLLFMREEARDIGVKLGKKSGWGACGPIEPEKGEFEFSRHARDVTSIKERGYKRHSGEDGDIEGYYLVKDFESTPVFFITVGGHRVTALAALGESSLIVRVDPKKLTFVFRGSVENWPQVKNGVFNKEDALSIFDRIYEAKQPENYQHIIRTGT